MSGESDRGKASVTSLKPNRQPKCRVLLVEDNLDSVHSMAALIKMMGHEVEFAINGLAAMDVARRFKPDFILLDIGLPDLQGDKIARQLKFEPGLERMRMIAITGLPIAQIEAQALEAGCEGVYAKPMAPTLLEELLAKPQRSE